MKMLRKTLLLVLPVAALMSACNKDEQNVTPTDDNEAITTATLSFTNVTNPADVVSATLENINTGPTSATLALAANTTYNGSIQLWDKTKTPVADVTAEIKEKANEHLFAYTYTAASGGTLTVTPTDKDTNPAPGPYAVGVKTQAVTTAAGSGSLRVQLRHQPNTKNGTATPGTSDLDITYGVTIK